MSYWQGPDVWHDGNTVETGDPRKDSRVIATADSPEMAGLIADALNFYAEHADDYEDDGED